MPASSPPSYGATSTRPSPHPHPSSSTSSASSSSLASKVMAVRAAHRLTSGSGSDTLDENAEDANDSALLSPSADSHGFRDPFPSSPVRFLEDPTHPHHNLSGASTPSSEITQRLGASIRFRPPRKSIDAGRLARQRSHTSATTPGGESDIPIPGSPGFFGGSGYSGATGPGSPQARRRSSAMGSKPRYRWLSQPGGGTGDEPGVDVRSRRDEEAYGGLKGKTVVTVVDYANYVPAPPPPPGFSPGGGGVGSPGVEGEDTEGDMNFRVEFPGERLGEWLDGEGRRKVDKDGKGVGVRWIHIQGLNWEVIKTLTLHYNLHPLAVEDALRSSNSPRSKLDFYRSHLYLQLLIHHIHHEDEASLEEALHGGVFEEDDQGGHYHGTGLGVGTTAGDSDAELGGAAGSGMGRSGGGPKRKGTIERLKEVLGSRGPGRDAGLGSDGWGGSGLRLPDGVAGVFEPSLAGTRLQGGESPYQKEAHRLTVDQLSAKYMVPIRRGIMSVFMTREGTIITLSQKRFREVVNPIYERLEDDQSLLRRSADVSMLAQAFLDIAADLAVEVAQTFEAEILHLEASVLVDPQMDTVRHLHVLSSQLIRLRRSITPLLHITCNIRDQDVQRSAAASAIPVKGKERGGSIISLAGTLANGGTTSSTAGSMTGATNSVASLTIPELVVPSAINGGNSNQRGGLGVPGWATPREEPGSNRSYIPSSPSPRPPPPASEPSVGHPNGTASPAQSTGGHFSSLTKVYMGDVIDHLEMVVSSMDQFVASCDHLTEYVFNVLSFQTNESMERLSIVSVIFLPLTFISSYFGMNFTTMPEIEQSSVYFWKIAAPSTFLFFIIFSFSYIRAFFETGWRRSQRWRSRKEIEGRFKRIGGAGGMGIKGE